MRQTDLNKVVFHSKEDGSGGHYLQKGEHILKADIKANYDDINEILELYNLKLYLDNEVYLRRWTDDDIKQFKQKSTEYGKVVGKFMTTIEDNNILRLYEKIIRDYIHSFWELASNQSAYKRISKSNFKSLVTNEPHLVREIITHRNLVDYYDKELRDHLLTYPQSAEILLSVYEVNDEHRKKEKYLPKSLTIEHKEKILSDYLDSDEANYNYVSLIQNAKNRNDFKVSDKTRLKAKRLLKSQTEKLFTKNAGMKYGVSVSFPENASKIKDAHFDDNSIINYSYSLDFIRQHNDPYSLFRNFRILFEYLDPQYRISLVSKKNNLGVFERFMGVHSQNEYRTGTQFNLLEMTSYLQLAAYNKVLDSMALSLENVLHHVFTSSFQEKYEFANNVRFSIPSATSYFEKVRLIAPEFESALKQFKLFVEDGVVDFELLQITSNPSTIKDIPSLVSNKYLYLNENNKEIAAWTNLLFSDQSSLGYVEPFKEKQYHTFFDILVNEKVKYDSYEEYQIPQLNYLIDKTLIAVDREGYITMPNLGKILILKDLFINEVASFHHYLPDLQQEAIQMEAENIIFFDSSLLSRPEQSYFNYFLNRSEFTNGLDLRNSYLHGTQPNPDEIQEHERAYFIYLKLIVLTFLKIEDDLSINKALKSST